MPIPAWITRELDAAGVPYTIHRHRPAYTAQGLAAAEHVTGHHVGKVTVAFADGDPVMLVLPASRRVDPAAAGAWLGTDDLRLATEAELCRLFPDCELGAMPPLDHWRDTEVWVDESMLHEGEFVFPAGTHSEAIHMDFENWRDLVQPRVADFAVAPV